MLPRGHLARADLRRLALMLKRPLAHVWLGFVAHPLCLLLAAGGCAWTQSNIRHTISPDSFALPHWLHGTLA